jgi:hypothetical protein
MYADWALGLIIILTAAYGYLRDVHYLMLPEGRISPVKTAPGEVMNVTALMPWSKIACGTLAASLRNLDESLFGITQNAWVIDSAISLRLLTFTKPQESHHQAATVLQAFGASWRNSLRLHEGIMGAPWRFQSFIIVTCHSVYNKIRSYFLWGPALPY